MICISWYFSVKKQKFRTAAYNFSFGNSIGRHFGIIHTCELLKGYVLP